MSKKTLRKILLKLMTSTTVKIGLFIFLFSTLNLIRSLQFTWKPVGGMGEGIPVFPGEKHVIDCFHLRWGSTIFFSLNSTGDITLYLLDSESLVLFSNGSEFKPIIKKQGSNITFTFKAEKTDYYGIIIENNENNIITYSYFLDSSKEYDYSTIYFLTTLIFTGLTLMLIGFIKPTKKYEFKEGHYSFKKRHVSGLRVTWELTKIGLTSASSPFLIFICAFIFAGGMAPKYSHIQGEAFRETGLVELIRNPYVSWIDLLETCALGGFASGLIISIFIILITSVIVGGELERGVSKILLSYPVDRRHWFLSKFLTVMLINFTVTLIVAVFTFVPFYFYYHYFQIFYSYMVIFIIPFLIIGLYYFSITLFLTVKFRDPIKAGLTSFLIAILLEYFSWPLIFLRPISGSWLSRDYSVWAAELLAPKDLLELLMEDNKFLYHFFRLDILEDVFGPLLLLYGFPLTIIVQLTISIVLILLSIKIFEKMDVT